MANEDRGKVDNDTSQSGEPLYLVQANLSGTNLECSSLCGDNLRVTKLDGAKY